MSFLVYIDDKPVRPFMDSFAEAKQFAASSFEKKLSVRIESFVAPAKSQIWIYDYHLYDWVEQI